MKRSIKRALQTLFPRWTVALLSARSRAHAHAVGAEQQDRHVVGVDKLMWGSDHPHANGAWGCSHSWIRATLGAENVKEAEARAILGESAVTFYGLDPDKINAAVERVGPTVEELLREPDPADLENPVVAMSIDFPH